MDEKDDDSSFACGSARIRVFRRRTGVASAAINKGVEWQ